MSSVYSELLKEAVPKVARVAVSTNPAKSAQCTRGEKRGFQSSACAGIDYSALGEIVKSCRTVSRVFAALNKQRPDGLYLSAGPVMNANQKRIAGLALKSRLPSMGNRGYGRSRWAHVLRGGHRGQLPARRHLRGQNREGSEACRSASGAADEDRVGDQSQNREADRRDNSAEGTGTGGQSDQVTECHAT